MNCKNINIHYISIRILKERFLRRSLLKKTNFFFTHFLELLHSFVQMNAMDINSNGADFPSLEPKSQPTLSTCSHDLSESDVHLQAKLKTNEMEPLETYENGTTLNYARSIKTDAKGLIRVTINF